MSHDQLGKVLCHQLSDHPLEPRQLSNIINKARSDACEEVTALSGDIPAILHFICEQIKEGQDWHYEILLNTQQKVIGLWWMLPGQVKLLRRYWDLLLNDNSYNRNQYGYLTNIGIIIAGDGTSRNAWYAFHEAEDIDTHNWVFRCHLEVAG
ncbi:hypothetical protein BT96DRAFT_985386 [Gymnopus androsaceus JB14]|uniref:MULE transposase domain-containing protein n=1 Tax=Gymnopus androsaceus JB14 TaxID=1447944 RepID=A0A6A4IIJ2_9AGAR|nr:hypothetical protein BT96DRAFT_985386 [Gymnopus androsaceus JB14]